MSKQQQREKLVFKPSATGCPSPSQQPVTESSGLRDGKPLRGRGQRGAILTPHNKEGS
jgi:hypothetical protein